MNYSSIASQAKRLVALVLFASIAQSSSAQVEYLPPIAWDQPPVVTPGEKPGNLPSDAIALFDGSDLSSWKEGHGWKVEDGVAISGKGNLVTKEMFGDCQLHVEWSSPAKKQGARGQGHGNSGVFFLEWYEIQILDSYQSETYPDGQAGAIYKQQPPQVNAMRPPMEWNTYDLIWTSPRIQGNEVVKPATMTAIHNGVVIINHFELEGVTYWHQPPVYEHLENRDENGQPIGSIMLQDHGNPVRFRNIWVRPLREPTGTPRPAKFYNHKTKETMLAE